MTWFPLACLTALLSALLDIVSRQAARRLHSLTVSWSWSAFSIPFILPLGLIEGIPPLGEDFWVLLLAASVLFAVNSVLYVRALTLSDISLTVPMTAFTPLFLLIQAPLFLGEIPSRLGLAGILLVVTGAYILSSYQDGHGLGAPFKALRRNSGPRLMLLVAFLYSITSIIEKKAILLSSPVFFTTLQALAVSLILGPYVFLRVPGAVRELRANWRSLLLVGCILAATVICHNLAVRIGPVAYIVAMRRFSILIVVLVGCLIFKESNLRGRTLGSLLMVGGVLALALA